MATLSTRQLLILDELRRERRVEVSALAREHDVADMTIRRDLAALERAGHVRRFHGGALLGAGRAVDVPYVVREVVLVAEKRRIAAALVAELGEGQAVFVDAGSTGLEVARALVGREHPSEITVVTASLRVLNELADEPGVTLISLGGVVRKGEHSFVGPLADAVLERLMIDVFVLCVAGVDAGSGLTEYNLDDAAVKRAVLERTERVVVTADHTKIGHTSFALVAAMSRADLVITDAGADAAQIARIQEIGVNCVLV